jgi:hypothetical protein
MTDLRQAAQQALEALIDAANVLSAPMFADAADALRTALEQPEQRKWVGLTEFQFAEIYNKWNDTNGSTPWGLNQALEAKLRNLNK